MNLFGYFRARLRLIAPNQPLVLGRKTDISQRNYGECVKQNSNIYHTSVKTLELLSPPTAWNSRQKTTKFPTAASALPVGENYPINLLTSSVSRTRTAVYHHEKNSFFTLALTGRHRLEKGTQDLLDCTEHYSLYMRILRERKFALAQKGNYS